MLHFGGKRPKLRDGAAFASATTVEILFQKQARLRILEHGELEKRRQGQRGAGWRLYICYQFTVVPVSWILLFSSSPGPEKQGPAVVNDLLDK